MDDTRDFVVVHMDGTKLQVRLAPYKVVASADWTDLTNRPSIVGNRQRLVKLATAALARRGDS